MPVATLVGGLARAAKSATFAVIVGDLARRALRRRGARGSEPSGGTDEAADQLLAALLLATLLDSSRRSVDSHPAR